MVVLLGDFNVDLLKYGHYDDVADFLDAMYSKLLLPNISSPTRITSISATLIDSIFTNNYDNTFMSGNLVTTLSDHLAQILIVPIQKTTRHKEPKKVHRDFQEILRNKETKILFIETYKILTGIRILCTPRFCYGGGGGGVELPTKFSKGGEGLGKTSIFRGTLLGKNGVTFYRGGCNFYMKDKLKSEIFNGKKSL